MVKGTWVGAGLLFPLTAAAPAHGWGTPARPLPLALFGAAAHAHPPVRVYSPATTAVTKNKGRFCLKQAAIQRGWQELLVGILTLLTAGLALLFLKPWLDFRAYQREVSRMRIDGRRLKFTGDLRDYITLTLKDAFMTVVTLGVYAFLGYPEANAARYVDEHIEWAEPQDYQNDQDDHNEAQVGHKEADTL